MTNQTAINGLGGRPFVRIRAAGALRLPELNVLWIYRDLLFRLAWRDIKVRYKQSLLGVAWTILQPTLMMLVFLAAIRRMHAPYESTIPYPLFAFVGFACWSCFSTGLASTANSVLSSASMISKVYFPRLLIPFAAAAVAFVDLSITLILLLPIVLFYGELSWMTLVTLPASIILLGTLISGLGTGLAALNIRYRDVRYIIPFFIQIGLFATPAVFLQLPDSATTSIDSRTEQLADGTDRDNRESRPIDDGQVLDWNPMHGIVLLFRSSLIGTPIEWEAVARSACVCGVVFLIGMTYFQRVEHGFADVI